MLPNDPIMLLSLMNMKLRDAYSSLDALCEDMDVSKEEIITKLAEVGYAYSNERNQFI